MSGRMFGSTCYTDKRQRRRAVLYTITYTCIHTVGLVRYLQFMGEDVLM